MPEAQLTKPERPARWWKGLLYGLIFASPLLLQLAVSFAASSWLARSREAWTAAGRSHEDLRARYPALSLNESAIVLERLAALLGCDLRHGAGSQDRQVVRTNRKSELKLIREWLRQEIVKPERLAGPPPDDVAAALAVLRPGLEDLASHLLASEAPSWPSSWAPGEQRPPLPVVSLLRLTEVLAAEALVASGSSDQERAERLLEAAWRQGEYLRRRPELLAALIGLAGDKAVLGALRKLEEMPEPWPGRLETASYRERMVDSLQFEALILEEQSTSRDLPPFGAMSGQATGQIRRRSDWVSRTTWLIVRPWWRLGAAESSDAWRQWVLRLAEAAPCAESTWVRHEPEVSRWNTVALAVLPGDLVETIWRAELDGDRQAELLLRIHEARHLAADGVLTRAEIEQLERPSRCVMGGWEVEDRGAGAFRIFWQGGQDHPYLAGKYREHAASSEHVEPER